MTERYIVVSDDEYCYTLDTQAEDYKSLEDFEKEEFENAKKDNVDIKEYEDEILESASDKYWEWVYDNFLESDAVNDIMNELVEENELLKQEKQSTISYLKEHYNYANEQRQNYLDNPVLAKAYDIIRHDIRQLALDLGVDLND